LLVPYPPRPPPVEVIDVPVPIKEELTPEVVVLEPLPPEPTVIL
jgi:hypothetical protein